MPALILIKHSLPTIEPNQPAPEWHLSPEGERRCIPLAERLEGFNLQRLFSSTEAKAVETAAILSDQLQVPTRQIPDLHEHLRYRVSFGTPESFRANVARFFEQPDQLVFGEETADQAHQRFAITVQNLISKFPQDNLGIVAHGTVISLFVARANGLDPLELWQRLGLPSFVALSSQDLKIQTIEEQVT